MNQQKILELPSSINVNISKGESGAFIADLPDYDIFTEADSLLELPDLVNDLIYTYFDVPKEYQAAIKYETPQSRNEIDLAEHLMFQKFISTEASRIFRS